MGLREAKNNTFLSFEFTFRIPNSNAPNWSTRSNKFECVAKLPKGLNATKAPSAYKPYRVRSFRLMHRIISHHVGFLLTQNFNPKYV